MQHAGQLDVVDVVAAAADEAVVLLASDAVADAADLFGLGGHVVSAPSVSLGSSAQALAGSAAVVASGRLLPRRPRLDRLHDVHVPGAPADVAADRGANLVVVGRWVLLDQAFADEHHAGRAEAALQAVVLLERRLHRVEPCRGEQALDGRDLDAVGLDAEQRAGLHRRAVVEHRAGAAARGIAPDVGAGEAQVLAEHVHQQHARLDVEGVGGAVDGDRDFHRRSSSRYSCRSGRSGGAGHLGGAWSGLGARTPRPCVVCTSRFPARRSRGSRRRRRAGRPRRTVPGSAPARPGRPRRRSP